MTRFLLLLLVIFSCDAAQAQIKPFSIGPYGEKAWMTGNSKELYKGGWGIGVTADIKLPARLSLTGSAGYFYAAGEETGGTNYPSLTAFPLKAGLKIRPVPFLYLKMEAGTATVKSESSKPFIWSPGIGLRVINFDLQAKYEEWSGPVKLKFWGLRASIQL